MRSVEWCDGKVRMIDQRLLPAEFCLVEYEDYREVALAIRTMATRFYITATRVRWRRWTMAPRWEWSALRTSRASRYTCWWMRHDRVSREPDSPPGNCNNWTFLLRSSPTTRPAIFCVPGKWISCWSEPTGWRPMETWPIRSAPINWRSWRRSMVSLFTPVCLKRHRLSAVRGEPIATCYGSPC